MWAGCCSMRSCPRIGKNQEVKGWDYVGIYDYNLSYSRIYAFVKSEESKSDISFVFSNSKDIKQFGKDSSRYKYIGLCDEKMYAKYGFSIFGDVAIKELGKAKTK